MNQDDAISGTGPAPAGAAAPAAPSDAPQEPVPGAGAPPPPTAPAARRSPVRDLLSNLRCGLGLLLRPGAQPGLPPALRPAPLQLVLLFALALALDLSYDLYAVGWAGGRFDPMALPVVSFWALATLLAAWALAALDRQPQRLLELATAGFALACWESVFAYGLAIGADRWPWLDRNYGPLSWAPLIWSGLAFALLAVRLGAPRPPARRLRVFVLALALLLAPQWAVNPGTRLWVAAGAQRVLTGPDAPQAEQTLYGQFDLLDDALDAIEPGQSGITELFTISFAGDGTQEVFLNEANGADAVMAEAFGSGDHSLVLANSQGHPQERPFATASALQRALAAMAERMNPDEDVLALVLSSNGTPDHRLVVSMPPYEFEDLTPERLRGLLDDAGIRYRVIVVSACYGGGYVDALAGDDTLVIAAAAADRTSFGCRDGTQWTDFGRAYFAEALTQTASFEGAFRLASQRIGAREAKEGLAPSQPQISVGPGIREQLRRLETRRGGRILFALQSLGPRGALRIH
jgi:hypothetical protein